MIETKVSHPRHGSQSSRFRISGQWLHDSRSVIRIFEPIQGFSVGEVVTEDGAIRDVHDFSKERQKAKSSRKTKILDTLIFQ